MYNGSNCDRKSQFSEKLTEPLNPRAQLVPNVDIICVLTALMLDHARRMQKSKNAKKIYIFQRWCLFVRFKSRFKHWDQSVFLSLNHTIPHLYTSTPILLFTHIYIYITKWDFHKICISIDYNQLRYIQHYCIEGIQGV